MARVVGEEFSVTSIPFSKIRILEIFQPTAGSMSVSEWHFLQNFFADYRRQNQQKSAFHEVNISNKIDALFLSILRK